MTIAPDPVVSAYLDRLTCANSVTLEVGCGAAPNRGSVKGMYVGIDITRTNYKSNIPRRVTIVADASALPFRKKSFNLVFYGGVCYHFHKVRKVIDEAVRVLKANGRLLVFDYSVQTVKYLATIEDVPVYPRTCVRWIVILVIAGLVETSVAFKSLSWKLHTLRMLVPDSIYFNWLDNRKAPIVVSGRKPW